ncbi:MAG: hypothetical protein LBH49_02620 [Puniceicoccales bacterium]|jgi:hypothetical protein|nr:hypothetical protein [Puniceicoccales bacterium]
MSAQNKSHNSLIDLYMTTLATGKDTKVIKILPKEILILGNTQPLHPFKNTSRFNRYNAEAKKA